MSGELHFSFGNVRCLDVDFLAIYLIPLKLN